jgi:hypothetical protein
MTIPTTEQKKASPIRAGVFADLRAAERSVAALLEVGFSAEEITVICSDETKERHFREFEHQHPAGKHTPLAAAAGGALGASLGGVTLAAGLATGGVPLIIVGGAGMMTGGLLGGFLGAMLTRGVEKEVANFYDQEVTDGNLLVAVECHRPDAEVLLVRAEHILSEAGAEPLPLPEG